jgi:hypothetical protein
MRVMTRAQVEAAVDAYLRLSKLGCANDNKRLWPSLSYLEWEVAECREASRAAAQRFGVTSWQYEICSGELADAEARLAAVDRRGVVP